MVSAFKQVYVSLFMSEDVIQLIAAEYFNTRFNIIKVEKMPCKGLYNFHITDKDELISSIKAIIEKASKAIGAKIEKVILVLPTYNFSRLPLRVSIVPTKEYLCKADVARAVSNSLKMDVGDSQLVVNASVIKYTINGISYRRMPEKEFCSQALVDIDLLCADKEMAYSYVEAVNAADLEVVDITLDNYSICKEALLFEQSLEENLILLDIKQSQTILTLLSKGKLVSTEIINEGFSCLVDAVYSRYHLPKVNILRLIKYNADAQNGYPYDAIFAWNENGKANSLNAQQLYDALELSLNSYLDKIITLCGPILEKDTSKFVLTGEGATIGILQKMLAEKSEHEVSVYYPESIGVRDTALCAAYGALFIYKEKTNLNELLVSCVNMEEYNDTVDQQVIDVEGESLTAKIKNLFIQYKNKGE